MNVAIEWTNARFHTTNVVLIKKICDLRKQRNILTLRSHIVRIIGYEFHALVTDH